MNDTKPPDAGIAILASFFDRHGFTAQDVAEMSGKTYGLCVDLARLQTTPDHRAVLVSLAGRQIRRRQATQEFRDRLARLERKTR